MVRGPHSDESNVHGKLQANEGINTFPVVASSIATISAATPYRPGVAPSPFPDQAAAARVHINPDTACQTAEDAGQPRHIQLAAWVECQILGM